MSTFEIMLASVHSQSAIYRGFSSLDTAVLFVIECLSLCKLGFEPIQCLLFHLVEACSTDCQKHRIKDKSMHDFKLTVRLLIAGRKWPVRCHVHCVAAPRRK